MSSIPGERLTSDLCLIVCAFLEEMWVVNGLGLQDFRHSDLSKILNRALPSPPSRRTYSSSFPSSGTTLSLHILLNNWGTGALALITAVVSVVSDMFQP